MDTKICSNYQVCVCWPDMLISELRPLSCGFAGLNLLSCVQIKCSIYVLDRLSVECTTKYSVTNHNFDCHLTLFACLHLQAVNTNSMGAKQQMVIHYKNVPLLTAAASVPLGNIGSRIKIDAMIKTASAVCRPPAAGVILSCTCKITAVTLHTHQMAFPRGILEFVERERGTQTCQALQGKHCITAYQQNTPN